MIQETTSTASDVPPVVPTARAVPSSSSSHPKSASSHPSAKLAFQSSSSTSQARRSSTSSPSLRSLSPRTTTSTSPPKMVTAHISRLMPLTLSAQFSMSTSSIWLRWLRDSDSTPHQEWICRWGRACREIRRCRDVEHTAPSQHRRPLRVEITRW